MAGSLASAGPAMSPLRWQRLPGDHLAEQDEVRVDQVNLAVMVRLQDLILGREWIYGHIAAVQDDDRDDVPVGVVSGYPRDGFPEDVGLPLGEVDRVGDFARDRLMVNPHDVRI